MYELARQKLSFQEVGIIKVELAKGKFVVTFNPPERDLIDKCSRHMNGIIECSKQRKEYEEICKWIASANRLKIIDSVTLTPFVRKALNHKDAVVVDWKNEALHGASFTSEVYRFFGNAKICEDILPWSLVLKMIRSPDGKDDPNSLNY